ncbi:hypothetical protein BDZ45DRAFT_697895 [Acephala macrosclerotiorum]|nr:hypothetical protein BDZ45DRAFT_697895 [Acephala macrosclerotiorum]
MADHKAHRRIHEETLAQADRVLFMERRHNSIWLAEKAVSFSKRRGDQLINRQNAALLKYRTDTIFVLGKINAHYTDEKVLGAYATIFDDLFFFGSLFPRCRIFLVKGKREETPNLRGHTTHQEINKLKRKAPFFEKHLETEITIIKLPERDRPARLRNYLGTLLHEMIHAFLEIWGCCIEGCYDLWQQQGVRGHGYAWQDAASALEFAVQDRELLGLKLDLGRLKPLAVDVVYERQPVPSSEELTMWGMRYADVIRMCDEVKKQQLESKGCNK